MESSIIFIVLILVFCMAVWLAYNFLSKSNYDDQGKKSDRPSYIVWDKINKHKNNNSLWDIEIRDLEIANLKAELDKHIMGNKDLKIAMILCFFTKQHLLIESVPWLAKTTAVKLFSKLVDFDQKRVQWTPDLLPSDIVGNQVIVWGKVEFNKWPIFTNILLFDEINRTTPKTQSALIQAMEEKQVTLYGQDMKLPDPFVVFATLNPIEQRWTYSLPEAQLDRFGMKVTLNYPSREEEKQIISISNVNTDDINPVIDQSIYHSIIHKINDISCSDNVLDYVANILEYSRIGKDVKIGWSPRSGKDMIKFGKCVAYIRWSDDVSIDDIDTIRENVLSHRIIKK